MDKKRFKKTKISVPLLKSWEQKRCCACLLHWTPPKGWANQLGHPSCPIPGEVPILTPPKGWVNHLSHPAGLFPGHTSNVITYKKPVWAPTASEQGNVLLVLAPPCCSREPKKALPEFLVWFMINSYWLRRPRNLAGNMTIRWSLYFQFKVKWFKVLPRPFFPSLAISLNRI